MYSLDTFLKPLNNTDTTVQIRTNDLVVKHTISPYTVKTVLVSNNLVRVSLNSQRDIILDFSTKNEAIRAGTLLESALETLRERPPLFIDKIVKEYINDFTLTNDSGFITSSALSGYVPYTGATGTVDLGTHTLEAASVNVKGTNGNGHIHLRHQASDATATVNSTTLFADSNGDLKYKNDGGYYTTVKTSSNTADRVYTFPNRSLTIDNITTSSTTNGTGFLKGNGSNISFDNTTYLSSISGLNISLLTNDSGYITSSALSPYLTSATAALTYQTILVSGTSIKTVNSNSLLGSGNISVEPTITAGTTAQYWRGDKTWQTLDKTAVGLGNVENTALSTWAGSTNITTLGTVATGTWSATAIGATKGGTGQTTYATGDLLYASAANTLSKLVAGTNGHVLTLAAGVPTWAAPSGAGWSLTGNAGTSGYPSNFIGTTDNQNVIFKRNNTFIFGLVANGITVGINTADNKYIEVQGSTTGNPATGYSYTGYGGYQTYTTNEIGFNHFNGGSKNMGIGVGTDGITRIKTGSSSGIATAIYINAAYGGNGNVGIGASAITSAKLSLTSTTSGFLPPVMTTTQRDAISSPASGLMIYDSTVNKVSVYNGSVWKYLQYE
jgi:hypothetical protein